MHLWKVKSLLCGVRTRFQLGEERPVAYGKQVRLAHLIQGKALPLSCLYTYTLRVHSVSRVCVNGVQYMLLFGLTDNGSYSLLNTKTTPHASAKNTEFLCSSKRVAKWLQGCVATQQIISIAYTLEKTLGTCRMVKR